LRPAQAKSSQDPTSTNKRWLCWSACDPRYTGSVNWRMAALGTFFEILFEKYPKQRGIEAWLKQ
jgi:hypothetical protein